MSMWKRRLLARIQLGVLYAVGIGSIGANGYLLYLQRTGRLGAPLGAALLAGGTAGAPRPARSIHSLSARAPLATRPSVLAEKIDLRPSSTDLAFQLRLQQPAEEQLRQKLAVRGFDVQHLDDSQPPQTPPSR